MRYNDYPFDQVAADAEQLINEKGAVVFQKFTCASCGARQTMAEANKFFTSGKCEECGAVTDIKSRGCNFMMVMPIEKGKQHE